MDIARLGNKYLADSEPWILIKTDEERVKSILYISLQICKALSDVFEPFLPTTSNKLKAMLNSKGNELEAGHQINAPELLFQKIEDEVIEAQIQKLTTREHDSLAKSKTP